MWPHPLFRYIDEPKGHLHGCLTVSLTVKDTSVIHFVCKRLFTLYSYQFNITTIYGKLKFSFSVSTVHSNCYACSCNQNMYSTICLLTMTVQGGRFVFLTHFVVSVVRTSLASTSRSQSPSSSMSLRHEQGFTPFPFCLLYTSDAADE